MISECYVVFKELTIFIMSLANDHYCHSRINSNKH